MRFFRAMLVLVPMVAFAGWRQIGTTAGITDIQMVDAGVVLSTAASGATALSVTDAGTATLNFLGGTFFVGAGYFGANCLVGVSLARAVTFSPGCGVPVTVGTSGNATRFRLIAAPPIGIALLNNGASADSMVSGPAPDGGWTVPSPTWNSGGTRSLQGARVGGIDYAVITDGLGAGLSLKLSIDAGPPSDINGLGTLRDAAPFDRAGAPGLVGTVAAGGALLLLPDLRSPTVSLPASRDAGVIVRYLAMGTLTGMATTAGGAVIGPIPDPARPAETWLLRGSPPVAVTEKISCMDDRWCVTFETPSGNIWFFENEFAPGVAVAVPPLDAGQTVRLVADAGDADGDPIFVSWSGGGGGTFASVPGVDDGTQVDFTAPIGVCAPATIDVTVSDGLLAHNRTIRVPLPIIDRGALLTAGAATALASGPPILFSAFIDGGCSTAGLSWSSSDFQSGSGGSFAWTPPPIECSADGGRITITTTATWSSGLPTTSSSSRIVVVQPWGVPNAPVFASPGAQQSGTTVDWLSLGAEHGCSTSSGFPGTELLWDAGAGFTGGLLFIDGGLRITAPLSCVAQQVTATVRRQVVGEDAGRLSPTTTLVVDVIPDTAPLSAATGFAISAQGDAGVLFGVVKTDAGCLAQRGAMAQITVFSGGSFVIDGGFPAEDRAWSLPAPGGCAGGTYEVIAELFEDGGFTGATDRGSVTLLYTPAKVGTLLVDRLEVVCGTGGSAQLMLVPAPNACGASELTWRAVSGPPLVTMSGRGDALTLQTVALDYSPVGQQIVLEWVADAGAGNLEVATRTIELGVQPFLGVSVKARPPLRREEEAVALEITLTNATDCAVEGLLLTLPLSGGSPIPESALIGDVRAVARSTEMGVVIEGVAVPAQGKTTVWLSARARLLSSPTVAPVVSLRGYQVSIVPPIDAPATGCGCSELTSPLFFIALVVVRRRRVRAEPARAAGGSPVASAR